MTNLQRTLGDVPMVDKGPWVTEFGEDGHGWNIHDDDAEGDGEGSGLPGKYLIGEALGTFADCWGAYDVETAARVFNLPPALIEPVAAPGPYESDPEDVGLDDLGVTVQVLSATRMQWGTMTVAEAAKLLNQHPVRIVEAVSAHCWMFVFGDRDDFTKLWIEHEGE
jgi:hypothetical protein